MSLIILQGRSYETKSGCKATIIGAFVPDDDGNTYIARVENGSTAYVWLDKKGKCKADDQYTLKANWLESGDLYQPFIQGTDGLFTVLGSRYGSQAAARAEYPTNYLLKTSITDGVPSTEVIAP